MEQLIVVSRSALQERGMGAILALPFLDQGEIGAQVGERAEAADRPRARDTPPGRGG